MTGPVYRRILLKLSGEMLAGDAPAGEPGFGIAPEVLFRFAREVKEVHDEGVQIGIVIGGGNIFRGLAGSERGMERAHADYMGMLATVINALALQDALEQVGCYTRVMSALRIEQVCEPYIRDAVRFERISHLDALKKELKVADTTAFSMSMENNLPIIVFDISKPGNLIRVIHGEPLGTIVISPPKA